MAAKNISLAITNVGKINAAAAVAYHHACIGTSSTDIWLNIGISGHKDIPVGEARIVNKITDQQHKTTWYPQILFKTDCINVSLLTIDAPSSNYQAALFDMEAAGFYQMAQRLGTAELIHCLKIVSDNQNNPATKINVDSVKKLIASHRVTIDQVLESLKPLAEELNSIKADPEHYQTLIEQYHFTQSERLQLSRLLRQWSIRLTDKDIMQSVNNLKDGKSIIKKIQSELYKSDFSIHD